jgi:hypothetical protein
MIAIDARNVCLDDIAQMHVRRWLELTFDGPNGICKLEKLLALTADHTGHEADATLAEQWDLWESCLELAGSFATAKPR